MFYLAVRHWIWFAYRNSGKAGCYWIDWCCFTIQVDYTSDFWDAVLGGVTLDLLVRGNLVSALGTQKLSLVDSLALFLLPVWFRWGLQARYPWETVSLLRVYGWVMSRVWMSNVTRMNESSHVWKSHVTSVKEMSVRRPWETISLRRVYKWLMSYTWISHVAYEWVMSHVWTSLVTCMNVSCHMYECVVSHVCDDLYINVPWLMLTCAMTHAYTCYDSCILVTFMWRVTHPNTRQEQLLFKPVPVLRYESFI